jgi:hypothetical protein
VVLTVRNGEKDGLSSNDKLAYMRMNACSATLTPVLSGPAAHADVSRSSLAESRQRSSSA